MDRYTKIILTIIGISLCIVNVQLYNQRRSSITNEMISEANSPEQKRLLISKIPLIRIKGGSVSIDGGVSIDGTVSVEGDVSVLGGEIDARIIR